MPAQPGVNLAMVLSSNVMYHRGAYHATEAAGLPRFHMRNAVLGLICATALALAISDIAIFGIAMWKIELAIAGALLFITAGKKT